MPLRLDQILYVVSTSLLVPVLVVLSVLLVWTTLLVGGFAREWLGRRGTHRVLGPVFRGLMREREVGEAQVVLRGHAGTLKAIGFVPAYMRACWAGEADALVADKRIDDIEIEMGRRLGTLATVGRLGPMLGLAGTLIPLSPALVELARGNIAALASQLVVAFSATIIGLLIALVAIVCGQVRRGWYAKDLNDILFLEELRTGTGKVAP